MAQTCFASSGRFCPMRRPLFQGLYFGLIAGSWLLDMNCPPSIPPAPSTDTVSIGGYYQSCECPVSSASLPFVTYAANGSTEPRPLNCCIALNWMLSAESCHSYL